MSLADLFAAGTSATPYGAAAQLLSGAISTPAASTANQGPVAGAPVSVNVSGFGSKSSGSATQSLQQAQTPTTASSGASFPASTVGASFDVPPWVLPAGAALLALVLVLHVLKR